MVKKRFEYHQDKTIGCYFIWDKYYGKHLMLFDVREHIKRTCDLLNELQDEILTLKSVNMEYEDALARLEEKNEQLKTDLFEARKDYLIETADISDKLYLDEMIEEERRSIFE